MENNSGENTIRFRNHISIIIERLGAGFWVLVVLFFGNMLGNIDNVIKNIDEIGRNSESILLGLAGGAAVVLLILIWQLVVWSKTYISVQENTIVIERNTLNRKKNTIGIKNISNVNTEQNLFEMLVGTCKVKLDTNSLSTADKTDVKIVLKKEAAKQFRQLLLERIQATENPGAVTEEKKTQSYDIRADIKDIMCHGIFSITVLSILLLLGSVGGVIGTVYEFTAGGSAGKSILSILSGILVMVFISVSAIWDILKDFIKYWDFKVRRETDKIHLSYGFLKKVNYTIPVGKINAVRLKQTFIARLTGRYMVEIINVGMGDDQAEKQAFLLLYDKKERIREHLHLLLPEFDGCLECRTKRQPGSVWIIWMIPLFIYFLLAGGGLALAAGRAGAYAVWMYAGTGVITALVILFTFCFYRTAGSLAKEKFLVLTGGYFGRQTIFIEYGKIQYLQTKQNILARRFKMQKGTITLLASAQNKIQVIPYCEEDCIEKVKAFLLEQPGR